MLLKRLNGHIQKSNNLEAEAKNGLVYITIPYKKEVLKDKTKTINVK